MFSNVLHMWACEEHCKMLWRTLQNVLIFSKMKKICSEKEDFGLKMAPTYAIVEHEEHEEHLKQKWTIEKCSSQCSSCISLGKINLFVIITRIKKPPFRLINKTILDSCQFIVRLLVWHFDDIFVTFWWHRAWYVSTFIVK